MPIVPSRAGEIERLIAALGSADAARRESAVARLTLLGERAVDALLRALPGSSPQALIAALTLLERRAPERAFDAVLALIEHDDPEVATRAVEVVAAYPGRAVVRSLATVARARAGRPVGVRCAAVVALGRLYDGGLLAALDPLVQVLLDEKQEEAPRLAALASLRGLPPADLGPIVRRLRGTRSTALAAELSPLDLPASRLPESPAVEKLLARLTHATETSPAVLRIGRQLAELGEAAIAPIHATLSSTDSPLVIRILADALSEIRSVRSIPLVHETLRRGAVHPGAADDSAWCEARAHLHLTLAALGSRLALYDLRELLGRRPFLGGSALLAAAASVGEISLVGPLVALAHDAPEWVPVCRQTLAVVAEREGLRRDARLLRRIPTEHHALLAALWPARRARRQGAR